MDYLLIFFCWSAEPTILARIKARKAVLGDFSFANPEDPKSGKLARCIVTCRFEGREAIFIRRSKKCCAAGDLYMHFCEDALSSNP
ncbi:hypothetical protein POTOM_032116 [Populus tomentosa]|uniref:Uncharacterized protein n=1 Tax=Populus tomentosa TaxID=118781 RepID=A0A8X7ZB54_POPTO|nr:hypothetical protein POTOM_032116 [Populus tomentosa]